MHRFALCFSFLTLAMHCGFAQDLETVDKIDQVPKLAKPAGAKIVLLNMWGQTCSRCFAEMPAIVRAVNELKNNPDVATIGLAIPDSELKNKETISLLSGIAQRRQLNYTNVIWAGPADPLLEKFNIQGTPYNALLSPDGKVIAELDLPENNDKAVEVILAAVKKALSELKEKEKSETGKK